MRKVRRWCGTACPWVAIGLLWAGPPALTAKAADVLVGVNVAESQQVPLAQIDHSGWDALLRRYVDQTGMVGYRRWEASAADVQQLDDYLAHLSTTSGHGTLAQQLAFWINAYNAVTIKGILREYPTTSIRNHTARVFGYNIWKDLKLLVGGHPYSLDQIEHQILRKRGEPRIHFAIVCASIGCPRLLAEAYLPERLEEQLATNTRAFFADPEKFRADVSQRQLSVSPILKWFAEDFGEDEASRLRWMAPWLPDESARQLARSGQARLSYLDYDWGLNDQRP